MESSGGIEVVAVWGHDVGWDPAVASVEEWSFLVLEFPAFPNAYHSRSEARRDGSCEHPETFNV